MASFITKPAHFGRPLLALALLTCIWGYNWVVMKEALRYSGAFQFSAIRTLIGAFVLFAVLIVMRKPLKPEQTPWVILLGILQTTGFTGMIIWALVEGGAGKIAVLTYTMPFWVLVLAWPLLGEKIRGMQWLAVFFSITGLACILEPWHLRGSMLSNSLGVLAGISWALSVILAKKMHAKIHMDLLSLTAWQMLFGSLPLVVVALLVPSQPMHWTPYLIGATLYNIIPANAVAWLLWLYALRHLPAGIASMGTLLTPVIGVAAAWIELGETPSDFELVGMLLIGSALLTLTIIGILRHQPVEPEMGQE